MASAGRGRWLFPWLLLVQWLLYFEAGAVPALLHAIRADFALSFAEQGAMGGIVYFCLSLACPLAGLALRSLSVSRVLGCSLLMHAAAITAFGLCRAQHAVSLIAFRGVVGACQSVLVVYAPVWVDSFSPTDRRGKWMSAVQASVPLGIMSGYLLATVFTAQSECPLIACWRWPFVLQGALTAPLALACLMIVPREDIDIACSEAHWTHDTTLTLEQHAPDTTGQLTAAFYRPQPARLQHHHCHSHAPGRTEDEDASDDDSDDGEAAAPLPLAPAPAATASSPLLPPAVSAAASLTAPSVVGRVGVSWLESLSQLLSEPVYIPIVLALCALYFVVTGVQFWSTDYLISVLGGDRQSVRWTFIGVSATAPILGVFTGGAVIDRIGGYQGLYQCPRALQLCLVFGACACLAAIPITLTGSIRVAVTSMWLLLFCGACTMPAVMGVMIGSCPPPLRPFASSTAVVLFNGLGYCLSPILSGLVMAMTNSMTWGLRVVLAASVVALLGCFGAWWAAWRRSRSVRAIQEHTIHKNIPLPLPLHVSDEPNFHMQELTKVLPLIDYGSGRIAV